jgi:glutamate N-acetyltransferase/amino-acid N-acetyltransferase
MTDLPLPRGFRFVGIHGGIRPDPQRKDLGLIVADGPATAAGVFTQNRVCAAPVRLSRQRVPASDVRGVVVCSGNANACTGARGVEDARRMTAVTAEALGCREEQVLVCSTGVIGRHLPIPAIENGIRQAVPRLLPESASVEDFARSIMTTDTRPKIATRTVLLDGQEVRVLGIAKGAAMIGPNMATMLAFVCTDAAVTPQDLQAIAASTAEETFNCVRVEGHTSTNDTLLLLASGAAMPGGPAQGATLRTLAATITAVCADLARAMAEDAEGASHLIVLTVDGLRTDAEARQVARVVADSALVKTAVFGADPNWGRIVSAAGYAGVEFEEENMSLWMGNLLLYDRGTPQPFDPKVASAYLKGERTIHLRLKFDLGTGHATVWTCDLTYEYVRLNAEYTT